MGTPTSGVQSTQPSARRLVRIGALAGAVAAVCTTVVAGLSLIPAIAAPDDTATGSVLVGTHLLAAAIIIRR